MEQAIDKLFIVLLFVLVMVFLMGYPMMLVWNLILPAKINFYQAVGINLVPAALVVTTCRKSAQKPG